MAAGAPGAGTCAGCSSPCARGCACNPQEGLGMDDTELARLHQAVQADPADAEARLALLQGLIAAEQWAEAHYNMGTLLLQQERYHEAIKALERALECRSTYPEAHFNRGNAHALRGLEADGSLGYYELDCAISAYKTAIQQRPDYAAALYNLGMVYQRMTSSEGLRVWDQYLEATQDLPDEEVWRLRAQEYKHDLQDRLR